MQQNGVEVEYRGQGEIYWSLDPRANENSIELNWYFSGYDEPTLYHIYLNGEKVTETDKWKYTIENLQPNTTYQIKIEAYFGKFIESTIEASVKTTADPSGEIIAIEDPVLERRIKEQLMITDRDIRRSDMESLELLDGYAGFDEKIHSLSGLEAAVNLEVLELGMNNISDVTPLKNLTKLRILNVYDNKVSDLGPLAGFTSLSNLNVSYNQITDLRPLDRLTRLSILEVSRKSNP